MSDCGDIQTYRDAVRARGGRKRLQGRRGTSRHASRIRGECTADRAGVAHRQSFDFRPFGYYLYPRGEQRLRLRGQKSAVVVCVVSAFVRLSRSLGTSPGWQSRSLGLSPSRNSLAVPQQARRARTHTDTVEAAHTQLVRHSGSRLSLPSALLLSPLLSCPVVAAFRVVQCALPDRQPTSSPPCPLV